MSWKTTEPEQAKAAFIAEYETKEFAVAELALRHGVSRKTAYKWLSRFAAEGWPGLEERSPAPLSHPNALGAEIEQLVLACKTRWPR